MTGSNKVIPRSQHYVVQFMLAKLHSQIYPVQDMMAVLSIVHICSQNCVQSSYKVKKFSESRLYSSSHALPCALVLALLCVATSCWCTCMCVSGGKAFSFAATVHFTQLRLNMDARTTKSRLYLQPLSDLQSVPWQHVVSHMHERGMQLPDVLRPATMLLAEPATGVAEGPTPASTPTSDAAEEAPPTPTTDSAGPSPCEAPAGASAAARLPVVDDGDAVKDAAGQHPPLAAASACPSEAVSSAAAVRLLSTPPCQLLMCTKVFAASCTQERCGACSCLLGFAENKYISVQTVPATWPCGHSMRTVCMQLVWFRSLWCQCSQSYLVLVNISSTSGMPIHLRLQQVP